MNLDIFTLSNAFGRIAAAAYGGQLLSWQTADGVEHLYTPNALSITPGRALRGGVPVCFPQFSVRGELPKHGLVRTKPWQLRAKTDTTLTLAIIDDDQTRALWPYAFELIQTIVLDRDRLSITLDFHNRSALPLVFTAALHTYLQVADVTRCVLEGLDARDYEDAADGGCHKVQRGGLRIDGEVDRVFTGAPRELLLRRDDMVGLRISQGGFEDTVVWCPGPEIAATFTDMPTDDWRSMLCVEAAAAQPVTVLAGGHWQGWQALSAANLEH